MELSLPPDLQTFRDEQLQSGKYASEADLYIAALQSLVDREKYLQTKRDELRAAVMVGTAQADRGEKIDSETAMADFREKFHPWCRQIWNTSIFRNM
jgi:Arc/MetJ-type ribon-helix-helix transcriptional regulator